MSDLREYCERYQWSMAAMTVRKEFVSEDAVRRLTGDLPEHMRLMLKLYIEFGASDSFGNEFVRVTNSVEGVLKLDYTWAMSTPNGYMDDLSMYTWSSGGTTKKIAIRTRGYAEGYVMEEAVEGTMAWHELASLLTELTLGKGVIRLGGGMAEKVALEDPELAKLVGLDVAVVQKGFDAWANHIIHEWSPRRYVGYSIFHEVDLWTNYLSLSGSYEKLQLDPGPRAQRICAIESVLPMDQVDHSPSMGSGRSRGRGRGRVRVRTDVTFGRNHWQHIHARKDNPGITMVGQLTVELYLSLDGDPEVFAVEQKFPTPYMIEHSYGEPERVGKCQSYIMPFERKITPEELREVFRGSEAKFASMGVEKLADNPSRFAINDLYDQVKHAGARLDAVHPWINGLMHVRLPEDAQPGGGARVQWMPGEKLSLRDLNLITPERQALLGRWEMVMNVVRPSRRRPRELKVLWRAPFEELDVYGAKHYAWATEGIREDDPRLAGIDLGDITGLV